MSLSVQKRLIGDGHLSRFENQPICCGLTNQLQFEIRPSRGGAYTFSSLNEALEVVTISVVATTTSIEPSELVFVSERFRLFNYRVLDN